MMKLNVLRLSTSPYYSSDFLEREKNAILSLKNVTYLNLESHLKTHVDNNCDIAITNTHTKIEEINISKLKLLIHPNSGYDNFNLAILKKMKCPIILGNDIRTQAVANYILGCFYKHYLHIPRHKNWNKSRNWDRLLLNQVKVGIVGMGQIGTIILKSLRPIVKNIQSYDPYHTNIKFHQKMNYNEIDALIICASLNEKNHNLIDHKVISQLPEDFVLINAARGELVSLSDLISHLKNNVKCTAYLDVFPNEPYEFEKLIGFKNIFTTSHIAGVYTGLEEATINFEKRIISDFIKLNEVKFRRKYFSIDLKNRVKNGLLI
jgi:D-3-phosphoglycerate dehydrogenase